MYDMSTNNIKKACYIITVTSSIEIKGILLK